MSLVIWLIASALLSITLGFVAKKMYMRPITITHDLNPYSWFSVHILVYMITSLLMIITDELYIKVSMVTELPIGLKGIICLFIQNGGLIVVVMFISSWVYNKYIECIEFTYFIERHEWFKKIFFTITCASLAIFYGIITRRNDVDNNILKDEYKLITIWFIVGLQIWIGFGMKTSIKQRSISDMLKSDKAAEKTTYSNDERKYIVMCIASMFSGPVIVGLGLLMRNRISEFWKQFFEGVYNSIVFGLIVMLVTIVVCNMKYQPNEKRSKKRFDKLFNQIQAETQIEYYLRVKYELSKLENGYNLKIYEEQIILDDRADFSDEYRKEVEDIFSEKTKLYLFQDYDNEDEIKTLILQMILRINKRRCELLKEGWDNVYKLCDEKERC